MIPCTAAICAALVTQSLSDGKTPSIEGKLFEYPSMKACKTDAKQVKDAGPIWSEERKAWVVTLAAKCYVNSAPVVVDGATTKGAMK